MTRAKHGSVQRYESLHRSNDASKHPNKKKTSMILEKQTVLMKGIIYAAKFAATATAVRSADSSPKISEDLTTTFGVHLDRHEIHK